MRSLKRARQRAQACRDVIGTASDGLLERVTNYLFEAHAIELYPANPTFLEGGRAEVSPAEGCLFYDEGLNDDPIAKLLVVLHELGHLELHPRLKRCCATPDPVYGSMYLNDGAPALARYNRRAREEAEANAFAAEFLCPSREVLRQWRRQPRTDAARLARHLGAPVSVIQTQLAEALYWLAVGEETTLPQPGRMARAGDPSQLEAAMSTGCPVLVDAGPGTGKTATLVQRLAYLLNDCGAEPEQFLVLTFSNAAAEELYERIAAQCGAQRAAGMDISTFHGFGVTFLHHHGQFLDVDADATILDEASQEELLTHLLGAVPCGQIVTLHHPETTVKALVQHIGYLKDRLYTPEDFAAILDTWQPSPDTSAQRDAAYQFLGVYRAYEAAKQARQCVDFADLIALPIRILSQQAALRRAYRDKYKWVLVDEYQDVSRAVAALLHQLCGPGNFPWVVGDTRQAIYRFRGAAPENVAQFAQDFPGARVFHLNTNYRSCDEIIHAANQLATLMETPAHEAPADMVHWQRGAPVTAFGEAVVVAHADSDQAEYAGIATQIETWLDLGVPARDIAVLARRNIDVQDIVLALGKRRVQATTAGLVTPEGAAGDLAAMATFPDQPRASLPRLAFALGRGRYRIEIINAVIQRVLETLDGEGRFAAEGYGAGQSLAAAMCRVSECLHARRFTSDAFTILCTFLFDGSEYLRRLLDQPASAAQSLALSEIVATLTRAASYRFFHPDAEPQASRKGFAQYFRAALSTASPSLVPPQAAAEAVRVMTCHAAKGLEFSCVIVAGQTLSQAPRAYPWLPPALMPLGQDDIEQANALFFVGVTRAQRALVVTYATSARGTARSRARAITPLLQRWRTIHTVPTRHLPRSPAIPQQLTMNAIWGGEPRNALMARALTQQACGIRTYLEQYLGLRFPLHVRPLYPIFFDVVRRVMSRIVSQAHDRDMAISSAEAQAILWHEWPEPDIADHPHHALYMNLAREYVAQFARAYTPHPHARAHRDPTMPHEASGLALRHDLLAQYHTEDGASVALTWRPESLHAPARAQGLLWSGLSPAHRASFVLLKQDMPGLQPYVFSAQDGVVYPYVWTTNTPALEREAEHLTQQLHAFGQRRFEATIREWTCDRCAVRLACPYWLGALKDDPNAT